MIRLRLATVLVAVTAAVLLPATAGYALSNQVETSSTLKVSGACSSPTDCGFCVDYFDPTGTVHWCTL